MTSVPERIRLYHIVHVDRLPSIIADGILWSDRTVSSRDVAGTTIGMTRIKERRLASALSSHPTLTVGSCVPFYFCPRSVMLFILYRRNHADLAYRDGQEPIIHLVLELNDIVAWAERNGLRWAFTLSNAGSGYFEDRADLSRLNDIDWKAVKATDWSDKDVRERKQAEFLVEDRVPWSLVRAIGVCTDAIGGKVAQAVASADHRPLVKVVRKWYY